MHGPYDPARGHRCNPSKLLVDPYALAITGTLEWHDAVHGHDPMTGTPNPHNSAPYVPRGLVVDSSFDWQHDRPPRTPWADSVMYEAHVRGLTKRHPDIPPSLRGTYRAVSSLAMIEHFKEMGVTAIELLPVHHAVTERALAERGLTNYWGYNTIGFFAPDARFATRSDGGQVTEFKTMVRELHGAGLEVILDVVYNHTAEGNVAGPTLSFRGIDNRAYYALEPNHYSDYSDYTGTGNTFSIADPMARRLVLDSLRYWVSDMHVDGFRFDLAPVLGRTAADGFGFFDVVRSDPVLAGVKLIAEPWDTTPEGYRLGTFPAGWNEWNGAFRDRVRRFWRADEGARGDFTSAITGSSDVFADRDRGPLAGINFITSHDGFTIRDLVSYTEKHNEPNGEEGRDGTDANWSRNWGVEGPTSDAEVLDRRGRVARSMIATLALSQGVPMLLHGDEVGRTQLGNNNAYCHDSELTWIDWEGPTTWSLLPLVRRAFAVRAGNQVFRRDRFFDPVGNVRWRKPNGAELTNEDWDRAEGHTLGCWIDVATADDGLPVFLAFNASAEDRAFCVPAGSWTMALSSAEPSAPERAAEEELIVPAHSLIVLEMRGKR